MLHIAMPAALLGHYTGIKPHVYSRLLPAEADSRSWRAGFLQDALVMMLPH